jgi:mannonate dehydratase
MDRDMTDEGRARLVDSIIVKTQGFVNGNIKEGDLDPVGIFRSLLALYKDIDRDALRENLRYFLAAIMPTCNEWDVSMCIHPDDPPFPLLGLPRIVTCDEDIDWMLHAVDDPHNGLTFCCGSLSAGAQNDVPALARKYAERTKFVHLRSTNILPNGDFIEADHLHGRANLIEVVCIFEEKNPNLPMRVDHGRTILGDEDKGYNAGYSFHGRMMGLCQMDGVMAAVRYLKNSAQ